MLHSLESISGRLSSIFPFSVYLHRWVCHQNPSSYLGLSAFFLCLLWVCSIFGFYLQKIFYFDDENLINNHGDDDDWFFLNLFSVMGNASGRNDGEGPSGTKSYEENYDGYVVFPEPMAHSPPHNPRAFQPPLLFTLHVSSFLFLLFFHFS